MSPKKAINRRPERLIIDFTETFWLIGIRSELEIFELVYHINLSINSKFKRTDQDILLADQNYAWPIYKWQPFENSKPEYIFSNWFESIQKASRYSLGFLKELDTPWFKKVYLLPELNHMDYFIKLYIHDRVKLLMDQINEIGAIFFHVVISSEQVKNPEILIFD